MEMQRLAKVMLLISCLLLPVLAIGPDFNTFSVQERYSPSAVVWSDNFNDNNTDGWNFWGMHYGFPAGPLPPNYSVSEGVLRFQGEANHWTIAMYNTTQSVGTWSFDLDVQDQYRHVFHVAFFTYYWDNNSIDWPRWEESVPYEYGIMPVTGTFSPWQNEFVFYRRTAGQGSIHTLARYSPAEIIGWHHFDITRDSSGRFFVYLNGTICESLEVVDTVYNTSECFTVYSQGGPAIDNIVVDDEFTIDQVPPFWNPEPSNQAIDEGVSFTYDLNATDYTAIDTWSVNDTAHFSIDSEGVITNATALSPDVYWLEVSVSDTLGYTRTAKFSVTVNVRTLPLEVLVIAVIGGGALVVIVIIVAVKRKS
ncbi:MAG: hypothetical protein ACFFDD_02175 [Promethearchaeota archaeon]